ncbi:hypothetical protein AKO1_006148 [Acrasis kona]|uniref:F-box domain-containing protein n=1 Tax=Acrasis kona TaxID=1008807 RepID=A0AAW2YIX0_9EUKA
MSHSLDGLTSIPAEIVMNIIKYLPPQTFLLFTQLKNTVETIKDKQITRKISSRYSINYGYESFDIYHEKIMDIASFSLKVAENITSQEFEQMKYNKGVSRPLSVRLPLFIIYVKREPSKEFEPNKTHVGKYHPRQDEEEHLQYKSGETEMWGISDEEWKELATVLHCILILKKDVCSLEINYPYDGEGYSYNLYCRMPNRQVYSLQLNLQSNVRHFIDYGV